MDATVTTSRRSTIGAAARLSNTPAWQLRAWERSGLLTPERSASGYRLYSRADIARAISLRSIQDSGDRLWRYAGIEADPGDSLPAGPERAVVHRDAGQPVPIPDAAPAAAAQAGLDWLRKAVAATWCVLVAPSRDDGLRVVGGSGRPDLIPGVFKEQEAPIWSDLIQAGYSGRAPGLGPIRSGEAVMVPV